MSTLLLVCILGTCAPAQQVYVGTHSVMVDDVVRPYAAITIKAPEPAEKRFVITITPPPAQLLSNGFEDCGGPLACAQGLAGTRARTDTMRTAVMPDGSDLAREGGSRMPGHAYDSGAGTDSTVPAALKRGDREQRRDRR